MSRNNHEPMKWVQSDSEGLTSSWKGVMEQEPEDRQ